MNYRAYAKDSCWEDQDGERSSLLVDDCTSPTRCALDALKIYFGRISIVDEEGNEVLSNAWGRTTLFTGSWEHHRKYRDASYYVEVDIDVCRPTSDWSARVTKIDEEGKYSHPYSYMIGGKKNV